MKSQFQIRPQSKNVKRQSRPISRYSNSQQAEQTFKKGKQQQQQGSLDKAIQLYLRAILYDPTHFKSYCNLGSCFRSKQKYTQSRSYYLKALKIKKDDHISHYNLANVQRITGNYQNSIQHYNYLINLKEKQRVEMGNLYINSLINIGICYKILGNYQKAIQSYEKIYKIDTNDEIALYNHSMVLVDQIKKLNTQIYHQFAKFKIQALKQILQKLLKLNKNNEMAKFQMIRVQYILEKKNQIIQKSIPLLRQLLQTPNCTIKFQINQQLGYCMLLQKNYEQSAKHYQKSLNNFYKNSNKQIQTNKYQGQKQNNSKASIQNNTNKKIQANKQTQTQKWIIQLQKLLNIQQKSQSQQQSKLHTLSCTKLYQQNIYKNGKNIQMKQISLEGHKIIGRYLCLIKKFQKSIQHLKYASQKIQDLNQKSKIHQFIGDDYLGIGNHDKAIEEYKKALEAEPQSFQLIYNLGCCYYESKKYQQSIVYFVQFIQKIKKQHNLASNIKTYYLLESHLTLSFCYSALNKNQKQKFNIYLQSFQTIKQIKEDRNIQNKQLDQQKMLQFYLQWADILQTQLSKSQSKKTQQTIKFQNMLLLTYIYMLDLQNCPDRDQILNNCATIYYEQHLYINALANFNQIQDKKNTSQLNIALTYLHLGQHFMANKYINIANEHQCEPLQMLNQQFFDWIYNVDQQGLLSKKYKNNSDQAFQYRWMLAIIYIDSVSIVINQIKQQLTYQLLSKIFQQEINKQRPSAVKDQIQFKKYKRLTQILTQKPKNQLSSNFEEKLFKICMKKSQNIEKDSNQLINELLKHRSFISLSTLQILFNLFVFVNRDKGTQLKSVFLKKYSKKITNIKINIDRKITIQDDSKFKKLQGLNSVSNLNNLIVLLIQWQCELENIILTCVKTIQKSFYGNKFKIPLQIIYNFPRHFEISQDNYTFNKLAQIIMKNIKVQNKIQIKGKKLKLMKQYIENQLNQQLTNACKNNHDLTFSLSQKLAPITINANFYSKHDCIIFLNNLQKQSRQKKTYDNIEGDQINVLVSNVILMKCKWSDEDDLVTSIIQSVNHPLPLQIQSVISLHSQIDLLYNSSSQKIITSLKQVKQLTK